MDDDDHPISSNLLGNAYDTCMFSKYKYPIVNIVFWRENFFLIARFPDHCLIVLFSHCEASAHVS